MGIATQEVPLLQDNSTRSVQSEQVLFASNIQHFQFTQAHNTNNNSSNNKGIKLAPCKHFFRCKQHPFQTFQHICSTPRKALFPLHVIPFSDATNNGLYNAGSARQNMRKGRHIQEAELMQALFIASCSTQVCDGILYDEYISTLHISAILIQLRGQLLPTSTPTIHSRLPCQFFRFVYHSFVHSMPEQGSSSVSSVRITNLPSNPFF